MRLQGKIVMVTGGNNGIGRATIQRFIEEGARVSWCDVDEERGKEILATLAPEHSFYKVDVTDRITVQHWVKSVIERHGRIDILINNAGIVRDGLLVKVKGGEVVRQLAEDDFDAVIGVNLKGIFNVTQAVVPHMIHQQHGVILNASSVVGTYGNMGQTNYVAAKSGVVGMTKVWARELGRHQIRVNAVSPGFIETDMVRQVPEKIVDRMREMTPLRRLGRPEEVADVYLWLACEEASFITGANIGVDGGLVVGT